MTPTLKCKAVFDADGTTDWSIESGANPFTPTAGRLLLMFQNSFLGDTSQIAIPACNQDTFKEFQGSKVYVNPMTLRIARIEGCSGGAHTLTLPTLAANDDCYVWVYECDGFPSPVQITSVNAARNASSSKNWSITSANGTPKKGDWAFAFTHYENSVALATTDLATPSGWTLLDVEQNAQSNLPSLLCYKQLAQAGAVTVNFSMTLDNNKTDDYSCIVTMRPILDALESVDYTAHPEQLVANRANGLL